MAGVSITSRRTPRGKRRYVVRYRLGGRSHPLVHDSTHPTLREARLRRDLIAGELAAGRNPAVLLAASTAPPAKLQTLAEWTDAYRASRLDASAGTMRNIRSHLRRILPVFGDRDPRSIDWSEVQAWVAATSAELGPISVKKYTDAFRLLLDYAGVNPNPTRDKRVRLPTVIHEEPHPPTASQVLAILDRVAAKYVLPLLLMEQTAMTVGETAALAWGDVEPASSRLRLRRATVKAQIRSRARWVQLPDWLAEAIADTCPPEDRQPERRVFPGITGRAIGKAMTQACKLAGTGHFHPHDLRHRRLSIWHASGVPARVLAERAGHARPTMTLDVYSHVIAPEEVESAALKTLVSAGRVL